MSQIQRNKLVSDGDIILFDILEELKKLNEKLSLTTVKGEEKKENNKKKK